jgi:signal transduction histidine kinase
MARPTTIRHPTFFWHGMLIILPVAILVVVAFLSLRRDKALAEAEAHDRARELGASLIAAVRPEFDPGKMTRAVAPGEIEAFRTAAAAPPEKDAVLRCAELPPQERFHLLLIGPSNELVYPPPLQDVPLPHPLDISALNDAQSNLWARVIQSEFVQRDAATAAAACEELLKTSLPLDFSRRATYERGLLLKHAGRSHQAAEQFGRLLDVQDFSEAGIPLRQLAALQIADDSAANETWEAVCKESVLRPSVLSEQLLKVALEKARGPLRRTVDDWIRVWNAHQVSREVYRQLPSTGQDADAFGWSDDGQWLVVKSGSMIFARATADVLEAMEQAIHGEKGAAPVRIPTYLGFSLEYEGRGLLGTNSGPLLASIQIKGWRNSVPRTQFKADVYLANAAVLYAYQRQRAAIFGLLVGLSALAALVGFLAARRAFYRQLRLSEMKSNFVSSVSHELRAPIASVRLMAEGLERGKIRDPEKQNEYFRFIVQECRRLSSLIENVLDFSRIEQGRKQYEFEPADAVILARETVRLMQTYAADAQIGITLEVKGDPVPVEMDGKAIQQALINLLDNAIKHSPKGSPILVALEFVTADAANPAALCLSVEDHGEGIPSAEHEKIFERFYRLGSELRRETQGVGIGLSIVKHIVHAHHGAITVRSAQGQGSRFTIKLPANPRI